MKRQGEKLPGLAWGSEDENGYGEMHVSGLVPRAADWRAHLPGLTTSVAR